MNYYINEREHDFPKMGCDLDAQRAKQYKDHKATLRTFSDGVSLLQFREDGKHWLCSLDFIFYGRFVAVIGDMGEATFGFSSPVNIHTLADFSLHRLSEKCLSSPTGVGAKEYDAVYAIQSVERNIAERRSENLGVDETGDFGTDNERLKELEESDWKMVALEGRTGWLSFLSEYGHDYFGDDWWEDSSLFGRCFSTILYDVAICSRMASDQLRAEEQSAKKQMEVKE